MLGAHAAGTDRVATNGEPAARIDGDSDSDSAILPP